MGPGLGLAWTVTVTVLAVVMVTVAGPHVFPASPGPPGTPDGDAGEPDWPEPPSPEAPVVAGDWPATERVLVNGTGIRLMVDLMVTMPVPVAVGPAAVEFRAGKGAPPEERGGWPDWKGPPDGWGQPPDGLLAL